MLHETPQVINPYWELLTACLQGGEPRPRDGNMWTSCQVSTQSPLTTSPSVQPQQSAIASLCIPQVIYWLSEDSAYLNYRGVQQRVRRPLPYPRLTLSASWCPSVTFPYLCWVTQVPASPVCGEGRGVTVFQFPQKATGSPSSSGEICPGCWMERSARLRTYPASHIYMGGYVKASRFFILNGISYPSLSKKKTRVERWTD